MKKAMAALLAAMLCAGATLPVHADDRMLGDMNGDGQVDAADAAEILHLCSLVGSGSAISEKDEIVGDANGDGYLGADDAALILQYAANIGSGNVQQSFTEYMAVRNVPPELFGGHCFSTWYWNGSNIQEVSGAVVISSVQELKPFCVAENNGSAFNNYSEFLELCETYDEAWFATHDLVLITPRSGSAEAWYEVEDITADKNNKWTIHIKRNIPIMVSPIDPVWYILVETNKGVESADSIAVKETTAIYNPYDDMT